MHTTNKSNQVILVLTLIVAMISALLLIFSKPIIFYDELINSTKASIFHIFDYALRPGYYYFNALVWRFSGESYYSLRLSSAIIYFSSALIIFKLVKSLTNNMFALQAVIIFLWTGKFWLLTTTAMPHVLSYFVEIILIYLISSHINKFNIYNALIFILLIYVALMIHPTNLSFIVPTYFCYLIYVLRNGSLHQKLKRVSVIVSVSVGILLLINYLYQLKMGKGYLSYWAESLVKIKNPDLVARYAKPFSFYYLEMYSWYGSILLAFIIMFVLLLYRGIHKFKELHDITKQISFYISLTFIFLISILILSSTAWKFDRLLMIVHPIFSIWGSLTLFIFLNSYYKKFSSKLGFIATCVITLLLVSNFLSTVHSLNLNKNKIDLIASFIRGLPDKEVYYLGQRSGMWRGQTQAGFSSKQIISLDPYNRVRISNDACTTQQLFDASKSSYILIHNSIDKEDFTNLVNLMNEGYFDFILSDAKEYQIWKINKFYRQSKIYNSMLKLGAGEKVMVIGKEARKILANNNLGLKIEYVKLQHYFANTSQKAKEYTPILVSVKNKKLLNRITEKAKSEGLDQLIVEELFLCNKNKFYYFSSTN
jgi:hypothetical protein